ncbi:protein PRY2-like isoform X3 [Orbicella faveolata]|uniref:protein PRY2-like isoform X3 n=1 Tax=Orbicella faveolata TaxID=48498 RepID=UPI0009E2C254|nr:protein PRY2-like isoform X3 [Orbicella faveolata]
MLGFLVFQVLFSLGSSLDGFDKNCLMATNLLRRRHGVPDLTWSETLAADARAWAHTLAQSNTFEHDYNSMQVKSQGENLAFFKPFKEKCQGPKRDDCVQCREIIEGWYDEVKNYDFGMGKPKTPGGVVMHFTQEVWKNSRQFGIGTAKSNKYGFIAVARYSPRGNRGGPAIFKDNVFPPGTISDPTPSVGTTSQPSTPPLTTPTVPGSPTATNFSIGVNATVTGLPPLANTTEPATAPGSSPPTTTGPSTTAAGSSRPITTGPSTTAAGSSSPPLAGPSTTAAESSPTPLPSATSPNTGSPASLTTTAAPSTLRPLGPPKNDSKCQYFVVNSTTYTYAIVQKCPGKPNVTLIPQVTTPPTPSMPPTTPAPPNPCEPNPCKNGGTCEAQEGKFTCSCPDGYWGELCEERGPNADESKDALMLTNMYRAMHQAPPVTWNKEIAAKAQDWADKLAKEQRLVHENESSTDYGENLAEVGSEDKALLRAIDAWYNEVSLYNYEDPKFSTDTGHYSQLVWGATNEIGMAKAKTRDNTNVYVVARYKPAGNVVNLFESNVKPKQ